MTLQTYRKDFGLPSAIGRLFTVYGEGASESHAIIASIAKTYIIQDPYIIWGNGRQIRNWTYVDDIVDGLVLLAEKVDDATAINLGTKERTRVTEMVWLAHKFMHFHPKKIQYTSTLSGPINRVADNSLAKKLLGWTPKYSLSEGLT